MTAVWQLSVNGRRYEVEADGMTPLAAVLRDQLGLTGTKVACGEGRCGACTVIVDDVSAVACLLPVALAADREIRTVEGLADDDGRLNRLQQALLDAGGVQCGMSTPGVLMTLTWLLEQEPTPDEAAVRTALAGNVCRCTGYQQIVDAVLAVVAEEQEVDA